ncbi:MAG: hypothetical protein WCC95_21785, partial [Candidatus Sulfotelmatobacter sp.]
MIRKFANASALTLLSFAILLGAQAFAQTTPAAEPPAASQQPADQQPASQQPAAQQPAASPSDQEPAEEESTPRRKPKPKDYKNWTFNAGLGASLESGASKTFVRQGGYQGSFGVARNAARTNSCASVR